MPTITSQGVGSGLDLEGLIQNLVTAEAAPTVNRLDQREASLQARLSGFGLIKSAVSSFQSSLDDLNDTAIYGVKTANATTLGVVSATASNSAAEGTYNIDVTQLSAAHQVVTDSTLANAQFTNESDVLGTGTLTFKFGTTVYDQPSDAYTSFTQNPETTTQSVTITDGSLRGIKEAVNNANIGVNASLIFDGNHYRLSFTSKTGIANSMEISAADADTNNTDASGLSLLAFNSAATHMSQTAAALDTNLTINGISVSHESNLLTKAIEGVTLDVKKVGSTVVTVSQSTTGVKAAVSSMVSEYNNFISTIGDLTSYDPDTKKAGVLNGDSIVRGIDNQVRKMLSGVSISGLTGSTLTSLTDIGISHSAFDGSLSLDSVKLEAALKNNFKEVSALFGSIARPTDALIEYESSTDKTKVGDYAINLTGLASKGSIAGSAAANLTITTGVNDTLTVAVGSVSQSITLAAGTYTAAALADLIKIQINSGANMQSNSLAVDVTENAGVLTITSQAYGSTLGVDVTGGTGKDGLFGLAPIVTAGLDVQGTIGGTTAVGSGQFLTGTGNAAGLKLNIIGGLIGARGTVNFTHGDTYRLDEYLTSVLDSDNSLDAVTDSLDSQISSISDDRSAFARRIESFEARLRAQFSAMDALVNQLQTTSRFLDTQLANLPEIVINK